MMKREFDIAAAGGGPAGLFAALSAAEAGRRVVLFEKLPLPGRKLLATGGGKCNIGNTLSPEELAAAFGRQGRFMMPALERFYGADMRRWFAERGLEITLDDDFHYFPATRRAADVLNVLLREAEARGVRIVTGLAVEQLKIENGRLAGVTTSDGTSHAVRALVLATGGRGYTALGGGTSGWKLAEQAGHTVKPPVPALVGLRTVETWPGECAGLSLPDVRVKIDLPREKTAGRGELLFTQEGISAYAVLDLSGRVAELLATHPEVPLTLDLKPEWSPADWRNLLARTRQSGGAKKVSAHLAELFPKRLAVLLAGADDVPAARLTADAAERLIRRCTALPLNIRDTDGWERAMVTRGGVVLKEIDPQTLASRLVPGLFFAGETVDLDGPCGGYNLSWAMASGVLSGISAAAFVSA